MLEVITEILNEIIDNGYQHVVSGFVRTITSKISDVLISVLILNR